MTTRFHLTPSDRYTVEAARQVLAASQTVDLMDGCATARLIGRLEVALERMVEMVDHPADGDAVRCPAAHPEDPTPCGGPAVVTVLDASNAGADGCEHHGARLLASLEGARVFPLPDAPAGAALRVFKAADGIAPFCWADGPRTRPDQLSRAENRRRGVTS